MPTPQLPGFGDIGAFIRWKKSIDYRLNLLFEKLNNVLANTGLSVPSPGVTQVDGTFNVLGTENVSGNLNVTGNETISGNLNVTGSATIGGATTISGATTVSGTSGLQSSNYVSGTSGWKFDGTSLEANTGVIGDGALVNPTSFGFGGNSTSGFGISTSAVAKTSITIPIPAGFTRALVHCTVNGSAQNSTGSLDFLYVSADIALPARHGGTGGEAFAGVAASGWGNAGASAAGSYASIGTGNITVSCLMRTGTAWAATGANLANVDATVTFLR